MAGSVNKVILVGNLGKDPEVRHTQDGKAIVNLALATSENWRDKSTGERKEKTEWHRVVIFNENLAKVAEQYLKKGSTVYIEGQLQTRKWTDKDGVEKYTTEVVLQNFRGELTMLGQAEAAMILDNRAQCVAAVARRRALRVTLMTRFRSEDAFSDAGCPGPVIDLDGVGTRDGSRGCNASSL